MLLVVSKRREGGRGKFWSSYPFLRPTNGARAGGGGVGGLDLFSWKVAMMEKINTKANETLFFLFQKTLLRILQDQLKSV